MANLNNYPVLRGLHSNFVAKLKIVCVFGANGTEVILVTKEDLVFAFGDNRNGCLGLSYFNRITEPSRVDILCNKGIVKIAYGLCHVMALTSGGDLYSWGDNSYGQCCSGSKETNKSSQSVMKRQNSGYNCPKMINDWIKRPIADITCGAFHTLILTQSGELFASGYNRFGQVGNGYNCDQFTPIKISLAGYESHKIIAISAGYYHSLALTDMGHVYSWGKNNLGQLGFDKSEDAISVGSTRSLNRVTSVGGTGGVCTTPTRISGLENIIVKKIICGSNHNLLLTNDFDIYTFGDNSYGQIGTESECEQQWVAAKVYTEDKLRFVDIAASFYGHISVGVAQNGGNYVWGECGGEVITVPTVIASADISVHDLFAVYCKPQITYKPITYFDKHSVAESIGQSFDRPNQSDLKFIVDNRSIYCHKCILRIRCDYFNQLFADNKSEKDDKEFDESVEVIRITEYSYSVYYSFLKYLYTDVIDVKPEDSIDLYDLATDYFEEDLKLKCFNSIKTNINNENVYEYYSMANRLNARDLVEFCYEFAYNNFRYLDPETKLKFNFKF